MKYANQKLADFGNIIKYIVNLANSHGSNSAFVIGLRGDLGAGKTTFTQHFAKKLGVVEAVTSPTFVILKIFDISGAGIKNSAGKVYKKLFHFDAYRIESETEMDSLGWRDVISDDENIVVLEWPEKIKNLLPAEMVEIDFEFVDESTRNIEIRDTEIRDTEIRDTETRDTEIRDTETRATLK